MFTWIKRGGTLKLYSYHIQANTPILGEKEACRTEFETVETDDRETCN
jgi:hypothetical protein